MDRTSETRAHAASPMCVMLHCDITQVQLMAIKVNGDTPVNPLALRSICSVEDVVFPCLRRDIKDERPL